MNALSERPKSSLRKGVVAAIIGFTILFAGFSALGVWQVQRLFWKLDLIEQVETRVGADPVPAPAPNVSITRADDQYRHVEVTGVFDHSKETLVKAVTEAGPGFWVLTPLKSDQGYSVLINRGFVLPEFSKPEARLAAQDKGQQTITGLLRLSEPKGGFLRTNDATGDRWFSRDVDAISAAKAIDGPVASYFIDEDRSQRIWPRGGMTVIKFANTHLVYALTWFGMALGTLLGLWLFLKEVRRRQTKGSHQDDI